MSQETREEEAYYELSAYTLAQWRHRRVNKETP